MSEPARERDHRDGARAVAPLAIAVLGFGASYGVLARAAGMGVLAPIVMSATTFAGSAQFAAASILGTGGATLSAITAAILLNARYAPIGVSVAPYLTGGFWSRFLHAQLTVDETWAVAAEGEGRFNPKVLLGAGLILYAAWVLGTILGVAFGDVIGDPAAVGLGRRLPRPLPGAPGPPAQGPQDPRGRPVGRRDRPRAHAVRARRRPDHRRQRRLPARSPRTAAGNRRPRDNPMSATTTWTVVVVVGIATIAIKALGPVLLGGRPLPPRLAGADRPARPRAAGRPGRDQHLRRRPPARPGRPRPGGGGRRRRDLVESPRPGGDHRGRGGDGRGARGRRVGSAAMTTARPRYRDLGLTVGMLEPGTEQRDHRRRRRHRRRHDA